jgi:hypothetical protein
VRALALTFCTIFLVAGGLLAGAACVAAHDAAGDRQEILAMEDRARPLGLDDQASEARARVELGEFRRAFWLSLALCVMAAVTLALAYADRAIKPAVIATLLVAALSYLLAPSINPHTDIEGGVDVDLSPRQRAIIPAIVTAIGALAALSTRKSQAWSGEDREPEQPAGAP